MSETGVASVREDQVEQLGDGSQDDTTLKTPKRSASPKVDLPPQSIAGPYFFARPYHFSLYLSPHVSLGRNRTTLIGPHYLLENSSIRLSSRHCWRD